MEKIGELSLNPKKPLTEASVKLRIVATLIATLLIGAGVVQCYNVGFTDKDILGGYFAFLPLILGWAGSSFARFAWTGRW